MIPAQGVKSNHNVRGGVSWGGGGIFRVISLLTRTGKWREQARQQKYVL